MLRFIYTRSISQRPTTRQQKVLQATLASVRAFTATNANSLHGNAEKRSRKERTRRKQTRFVAVPPARKGKKQAEAASEEAVAHSAIDHGIAEPSVPGQDVEGLSFASDPLSPFSHGPMDMLDSSPTWPNNQSDAWMSLQDRLSIPSSTTTASMGLAKPAAGAEEKSSAPSKLKHPKEKPSSAPVGEDPPKKPKKASRVGREKNTSVTSIIPYNIENKPVETDAELDVPRLQHNLDRVLFNPGVHVMRDPRSRVYNFDPEIAKIMPASEFDYDALGEYITSSKDEKLRQLCVKYNKKYCGSTSSLSAILSHFHYLISAWRKPNFQQLSRSTEPDSSNFTQMLRSPAAAFASFRNGSYAIDADKEYDEENILASLGKSMEKHFLLPKEEFEKYRRSRSHEISDEQRNVGETYHYSELGDFLVRSQLDAYDPRLPGSGVFDIKTRAVVSIRMDVQGYEKGLGYEISQLRGQWHSFEREYMDMIRAAFLKYSLQVRMGRMDGIFCAYHNTQRIFGYQYIPISEMDVAIHGTDNTRLGDEEFKASISMLNALMDKGTQRWPGRTLRLHVETRDTVIPLMYFFIEPVSDSTMAKVQDANKSSLAATAAKVVEKIKGLQAAMGESAQEDSVTEDVKPDEKSDGTDETTDSGPATDAIWEELMLKVEDVVENDTNGLESVKAAVLSALDRHGLREGKTAIEVQRDVNTLVEALVGSRQDDEVAPAESDAEETAARPEGGGEVDNAASESFQHTGLTSSTEDHGPDAIEGDGVDPGSHAERISSLAEAEAAGVPNSTGSTLQELVLRAAEEADKKSGELRAFERVFAELSAEARAKDSEQDIPTAESEEAEGGDSATAEASVSDYSEAESNSQSPENSTGEKTEAEAEQEVKPKRTGKRELLGMVVTVKNKVDGSYVDRPKGDYKHWTVQYSIQELEHEKALRVYKQMKRRRSGVLSVDRARRDSNWHSMWKGDLKKATKEGQELRERLEKEDQERQEIHVAWEQAPRPLSQK